MNEERVFVCGTRCVVHVKKSDKHGCFEVRGATSRNVMMKYPYDERQYYSEKYLTGVGASPKETPKAWANLTSRICGKTMQSQKEEAIRRATNTSSVVTKFDR
jgi:hypothetical protein